MFSQRFQKVEVVWPFQILLQMRDNARYDNKLVWPAALYLKGNRKPIAGGIQRFWKF